MTWLRVVISVVVGGVDDDIVDYVLGDVGTHVLVVGASVVLGGEDDDVVAVVGTVVVNDVDGGVVSPVEVGGVVDVCPAICEYVTTIFMFFSFIGIYLFFQPREFLSRYSFSRYSVTRYSLLLTRYCVTLFSNTFLAFLSEI